MNYLLILGVIACSVYMLVPTVRYWADETARLMALEISATLRKELIRWAGLLGLGFMGLLATPQGSDFVESMVERFDGDTIVAPVEMNAVSGGGVIGGVVSGVRERALTVLPPAGGGGGGGSGTTHTNLPSGMDTVYIATGSRGNDQLSQGFTANDDGVCSPNGCWAARTDTITTASYNAPTNEGDSILFRHNHPGNGSSSNSNFAGNIIIAEWDDLSTFSGVQDYDTVYIYISNHENGQITAEHGRKLFFLGVERGAFADSLIGGADIFPTWESSNVFTFQYQAGLFDDDYTSGGGSAGNWSSTTPGAGLDSVWVVHEFLIKGNTEGLKDGALTWWVNGDTVFHSDTMRFEQSGSAGCTNGVCGISGLTLFMNTDAATSNQHYFYTGEIAVFGKGGN